MWDQYNLSIGCYKCTWEKKSRRSLWTNISERKGHSEKLGFIKFQIKFPPPTVMRDRRDFLLFGKEWNWEGTVKCFKGRERHFLSCYSLFQDLYWKINWDPACSALTVLWELQYPRNLLWFFFSQSCLYLTYSRTVKGTGNGTHVQVSLIELPGENRDRDLGFSSQNKNRRQHRDLTPPIVNIVEIWKYIRLHSSGTCFSFYFWLGQLPRQRPCYF